MNDTCPCSVCEQTCRYDCDTFNGTICESSLFCPECGYEHEYAYGNNRERIGEFEWWSTYSSDPADYRARGGQRAVAILIRRLELGILAGDERAFAAAIAAALFDRTPALVFADWLAENGREWESYSFRDYPGRMPVLETVA